MPQYVTYGVVFMYKKEIIMCFVLRAKAQDKSQTISTLGITKVFVCEYVRLKTYFVDEMSTYHARRVLSTLYQSSGH